VDMAYEVVEDFSQDQFWENCWKPICLIFPILNHRLTVKNPALCSSGRRSISPREIFTMTLPGSFSPEWWQSENL